MSLPERSARVQHLFTRIASRYDLMNRLMTGGQDGFWRREVIARAALQPGACLLDLGAGTGDLAREALKQQPTCQVTAADFTLAMMLAGRSNKGPTLTFAAADALHLPFCDAHFDGLVSGFLLRNVVDLPRALAEQFRVLKPGGRWVALDTTQPRSGLLTPLVQFYMHRVIPLAGRVLTGDGEAYRYLPETTQHFLSAEALQEKLIEAGFRQTGFRRLNFGTIAIHWGVKP
ncbi:MAG TPA: ubiquinone/menaquinone biosynthesis methyltransferase [Anaerolineaceae bacterium]|nr:ubiquinone/menaquinone biosynthesis methyltransferase [Anaerolineaceae bacterium]HPN51831.1 ubiquinone/menaquinone biosynthesis methyltransferase [Anaerolineaceae bacterium]